MSSLPVPTVGEALALMHEHSIRRLPVVMPDGELCGIIIDGEIRGADICRWPGSTTHHRYRARLYDRVRGDDRTSNAATQTGTLREVALLMLDNKIGGLPVVDANGAVAGIVTESDCLRR